MVYHESRFESGYCMEARFNFASCVRWSAIITRWAIMALEMNSLMSAVLPKEWLRMRVRTRVKVTVRYEVWIR